MDFEAQCQIISPEMVQKCLTLDQNLSHFHNEKGKFEQEIRIQSLNLDKRKQTLDKKENSIEDRERKLAKNQEEIAQREQNLAHKEHELDMRHEYFKALEEKYAKQETELKEIKSR